ncbi:hypothetical protein [Pengzhenrongella sp.]|uniref:hypothetical protein n=1 Tax=Pengzhenrongella sp. TaxID=2888820 RepID=UPI002F92DDC3
MRRTKGSENWVGDGREVAPDPGSAAGYDALFGVYRRMYPALRGLFPDLAAAAEVVATR